MNKLSYNVKFTVNGKIFMKKVVDVDGREDAIKKILAEYPRAEILKTYVAMNAKGEIL
jgi:hypothetical protein